MEKNIVIEKNISEAGTSNTIKSRQRPIWAAWVALALLLIFCINFLPGRLDLTSEKRFSISQPTKNLLKTIEEPLIITVLLQGEKMPAGFKKLKNATAEFLETCKKSSGNQIIYNFVEPEAFLSDSIRFPLNDTAKREWLKANAVKQNEQDKSGIRAAFNYPIALLEYNGKYGTVNLLQGQGNKGFLNPGETVLQFEVINNAEAQMEYNFASAIQLLTRKNVPMLAYATGNGEPDGPETYDLQRTLSGKYQFYTLNLKTQPYISDSIKALLVVKPSLPFSEEEKLKIDQYIMRGGRVLFLIDALNADMDSLIRNGREFTAYSRNLRLDDILFKYGARINSDLVEDLQCDILPQAVGNVGGQPQIELLPWPYFPLLYSTNNHPISKNLDAVVMQFPNSVDTVAAADIQKEILLTTSNTSRLIGSPVIVTVEIAKQIENASAYKQANIPLAVLLEGKFKSLYANRLSTETLDSLKAADRSFLASATKQGKLLITGDGDWILNSFSKEGPRQMGENRYTGYSFANKDFLQNTLEYFTDENGITASRSKQFTLRLLNPKRLEKEKTAWIWLNVIAPVILVIIVGVLVQWYRKRKFTA